MPTIAAGGSTFFLLPAGRRVVGFGKVLLTATSPLDQLRTDGGSEWTFGPFGQDESVSAFAMTNAEYSILRSTSGATPTLTDSEAQYFRESAVRSVPASFFGVQPGPVDMTTQLERALNAAFYEGWELTLPYGDVNISGLMAVTAPQGSQTYPTYVGSVNWRKPVGVRGFGPLASRIVQNQAGVGIARYFPTSGNFAHGVFQDFSLVNVNEDYTNTGQFGIQIGGGTADCVSENHRFINVSGVGQYAVIRMDDCTGALFTGSAQNQHFKYYAEGGYNSDQWTFRDFYMSHDHPTNVACTSSTGTTISGISSAVMPYLFIGGSIVGAGIPADTTIVSKGTTSIGVSNSVTAVTSFAFKLGTLLSLLSTNGSVYGGSGWAAIANAANYANKTRASNPNLITFDSVLWNRAEGLIEDYGSAYSVNIRGVYMEAPKRIGVFAGTGLKGLDLRNLFLSQPESMRQPMIEIASGTPEGCIRSISTDGVPNTTTVVNMPNASAASEWGEFEISNVPGNVVTGGGPVLSASNRTVMLGSARNGSAVLAYTTASGDANFDGLGIDRIEVTLTQSGRTINGPNSVQTVQGRTLDLLLIQDGTGGRTITLAAKYRKPDGTQWGLLPSGTANQRALLRFTHLGNGLYVSDKSTLAYV